MEARRALFEQTLENAFDIEQFVRFSMEFFKQLDLVSPDKQNKDYFNWREFSFHINGYHHIANFSGSDKAKIAIFAVQLKDRRNLDRARSLQRNFIKKLISSVNLDGALVAFYADGETKWRLSFIKLDYEFSMGKVTEKITPAKRYSYLVGKGEPCHTALERLYPIFMNEEINPSVAEIEEAFSVEKVTKEFFEKYKEKYFDLKEHLESNPDFISEAKRQNFTSEQFAKKLMGQIAFLYFIQKKGWLGVNAFPNSKLKKFFTKKEYEDLFWNHGKRAREVVPKVFRKASEDEFILVPAKIKELTQEEQETLANAFRNHAQSWGTGPRDFIRRLYEHSEKNEENFYDDYLEPLFYEALNKKREANDYYHKLNCRIPFLNGGLFDPLDNYDWKANDFAIPNNVFSNTDNKGTYDADGILDIFDRYNFTMNEDEPLEKEVAVDPEMLGKVFENLLEGKDRKAKGAFYTPREIVHYMCQESLVNYLVNKTGISYNAIRDFIIYGEFMKDEDTAKEATERGELYVSNEILNRDRSVNRLKDIDDALANITVADPAVGSGAFPLGMVSEIVKARRNITEYLAMIIKETTKSRQQADFFIRMMYEGDRHPLTLKLHTIKNSIFAVDIEPSAVDIAKLRLWLSLVVEQEINEQNEDDGKHAELPNPRPLPNLDCNIRCGNSLIDEIDGEKLINESELLGQEQYQTVLGQSKYESLLKQLFEAQDNLFSEKNHEEKEELKIKIQEKTDRIVESCISYNPELVKKYNLLKKEPSPPYFLWQIDFARVFQKNGGFDVVIGNPPYVGERGHKDIIKPIAQTKFGKKYYQGKMDIFYFFFHKAFDISNDNGEITFITTNYYPTAYGAKKLRIDMKERVQLRRLINFNEVKVFESALGQHNMITMCTKNEIPQIDCLSTHSEGSYTATSHQMREILYGLNIHEPLAISQDNLYDGDEYYIRFSGCASSESSIIGAIIKKMQKCEKHLGDIANVNQGVVSGCDYVSNKSISFLTDDTVTVKDGIFVLNLDNPRDNKAVESISNSEKHLLRAFYKNSDIKRYWCCNSPRKLIIYYQGALDCIKYPNIYTHLLKFKGVLQRRLITYNEKYDWTSIHRTRVQDIFYAPKIVVPHRSKINTFAYNDTEWFCSADVYVITKKNELYDIMYILALLNSKLYFFWLYHQGKRKGELLELYQVPLCEIPIPSISLKNQHCFSMIANEIVQLKKTDHTIDTTELEVKIDNMVYGLFDMTDEEISIVENEAKILNK